MPRVVEGLFRDGGRLVIQEGAEFPERCVVCNKAREGEPLRFTFKREKSHYLEVRALQTLAAAASDLLKGAKYTGPVQARIPFCSWHRRKRLRRFHAGTATMALAAAYLLIRYMTGGPVGAQVLAISIDSAIVILVAIAGLGVVLAAAYDPARVWFKTTKFHDRLVWVEGAGREFLNTLPILKSQTAGASSQTAGASRRRHLDESNLGAEELIRRARLAGLADEE
jgi:hypothetical protein